MISKPHLQFSGFAIALAGIIGLGIGASPLVMLAGLLLLLVACIGLIWPAGLLYLSIASMVVGQMIRLPIFGEDSALLLNDLFIPALVAVWLVRGIFTKSIQLPRMSLWIPLIGVVMAMILSGLSNFFFYDQREWISGELYLIRWLEYAALLFIVYDLGRAEIQRHRFFIAMIGSAVLVAILGFVQLQIFPDFTSMVPQGWDPHIGRLLSTWFDPNFLGGWLAIFAGITLALALTRPSRNFGWWTLFVVLTLAEILTYSRSGYLGFVASIFVVTVVRSRALLFLGALALLSTVLLVPRVQERVLGIRSVDQTAQFRLVSWNNALDIIRDHPFLGVGYNHYKFVQQQRGFVEDVSEHSASGSDSSLLTIFVTTGVVGLGMYLWLYGAICWEFFRTARSPKLNAQTKAIALGSLAGMIGLFVHSQFVNGWFYPHIMETVWVLLALTLRERSV